MLPDLSVKLYAMLPDLSVKLYAGHKSSTPPGPDRPVLRYICSCC